MRRNADDPRPPRVSARSAVPFGVEAVPVRITVKTPGRGRGINLHGLSEGATKETRLRVTLSLKAAAAAHAPPRGAPLPESADILIESTLGPKLNAQSLDHAIAMALRSATTGHPAPEALEAMLVVGELDLQGNLRGPTRGVAAMALLAMREGWDLVVPEADAALAVAVTNKDVYAASRLDEQVYKRWTPEGVIRQWEAEERLRARSGGSSYLRPHISDYHGAPETVEKFTAAVRAGQNILLVGPPGSGKTILARAATTVLYPMTDGERIDVGVVESAAGRLPAGAVLPMPEDRPFRAPHHTVSDAAMVGGGTPWVRPGEVSLATHGVLFLDELPEFRRSTLEVTAHAIQNGEIAVGRMNLTTRMPAAPAIVIASANPCPCGYLGNPKGTCRCSASDVERYRARVAPFVDALKMVVTEVPQVTYAMLRGGA